MLKAEATDMKMLPVAFDYDFAAEAKSVFEMLKHREALSVWDEVDTREHRMLDEMVSGFFGISAEMDNVRRDLIQQVQVPRCPISTVRTTDRSHRASAVSESTHPPKPRPLLPAGRVIGRAAGSVGGWVSAAPISTRP